MIRPITILINFPHLDELIQLGNRYLDFVRSTAQTEADALAKRLKAVNAKTKAALAEGD